MRIRSSAACMCQVALRGFLDLRTLIIENVKMYLKNFKKINASNIRKKFVLCPLNSNLQILSKMFLNMLYTWLYRVAYRLHAVLDC